MAEAFTSMKTSLIAGSFAGLSADLILFPLDTIKTRLQASSGFVKAGGFKGLYSGIGSVALGSVPSSSFFFLAYESTKNYSHMTSSLHKHMLAACVGEMVACFIRAPFEVIKQRAQASYASKRSHAVLLHVLNTDGLRGLYRGLLSMLMREVPFSLIQMPLWESLKNYVSDKNDGRRSGFVSGVCGSVAGGISAGLTTPLDVAKTRIILAQKSQSGILENPFMTIFHIKRTEGISKLFSGIVPRMLWISAGGFIFLGAYDGMKILLDG